MSNLRPRNNRNSVRQSGRDSDSEQDYSREPSAPSGLGEPGGPVPAARHGQLKRRSGLAAVGTFVAAAVCVAVVSTVAVLGIATWDVTSSLKKSVALVDANGKSIPVPEIGAMDGSFNVLLAGSDSGGGNAAYGDRGESLNDVTMLLHVSGDHKHATVVSFPRDMYVSIPSCPDPQGGSFSAMSYQKINTTLTYGGLACTVLTVEKLTGLTIPYAAEIQFDGVIEMSDAVGGVPVCVAGNINDPYTGLSVTKGENTLQGAQALAFLRSRHGVGDGSDLGRISSQQVFLSSLVRTVRSSDTLANPLKVYALAKAAAKNMSLSSSMNNITTISSMAFALKGVDPSQVVFVQYPNHYVEGGAGVAPTVDAADALFTALKNDTPITLTGATGVGSEADPSAPGSGAGAGAGSAAAPSDSPTSAPGTSSGAGAGSGVAVQLPSDVTGQTAGEHTCAKPFSD